MKTIYLDNSATTPLDAAVAEKMRQTAENVWGNPSSLHSAGLEAEKVVTAARRAVLAALGIANVPAAGLARLIFTGSGTEANNLAIFGTAYAKKSNSGARIITTPDEHPSIAEPLARLQADGFEVVSIPVRGGKLDLAAFEEALTDNTLLVSIMSVNNETGAAYNVKTAFSLAKKRFPRIITHTDAVQSFFKLENPTLWQPDKLGADLITVSAHKINGPKGIGALCVNPALLTSKRLVPVTLGGGQEHGMRSGTENVVAIAGFGEAVRLPRDVSATCAARQNVLKLLADRCPGVVVNLPPVSAPHILSLTLPNVMSETMVHFLSEQGIFVSSGSACSSHSQKVSRSLTEFGVDPREAVRTIRVSLSPAVTADDCEAFVKALTAGLARLGREGMRLS